MIPRIARFIAGCAIVSSALVAQAEPVARESGFPIITSYSSDLAGMPITGYCAAQAPNGVLFFGGRSLLRFDGEQWAEVASPEVPFIYGLDFGAQGRLWAAVESDLGWFEPRPGSRYEFHSLKSYLKPGDAPRGPVWQVLADGAGAVFVSSDRVYRWDGTHLTTWSMPGVRRLNAFRIKGRIYVDYRRAGLYRMASSGSGLTLVIPQTLIGNTDTGAILWIDPQPGHWLLVTGNGLLRYQDGRTVPFAPEVSRTLRDAAVTMGARLSDGRYAFSTFRNGIVLMDRNGAPLGSTTDAEGLPAKFVSGLLVDHENNVWATSMAGIFRINFDPGTRIFDARSKQFPHAFTAIGGAQGRLLVGNANGLFSISDNLRDFSRLPLGSGPQDIVPSPDGPIICGYRGAWRYANRSMQPIRTTIHDVTTALASHRRPGEIYFGESPDPSVYVRTASGEERLLVRDLPGTPVSLHEDDLGQLWIATFDRGIWVARTDSRTPVEATPATRFGLPDLGGIAYVRRTRDDSIVVLSNTGAWIKPSSAEGFSAVRDFPGRRISSLSAIQPDNTAWVVRSATATLAADVEQLVIHGTSLEFRSHSIAGLERVGIPTVIYVEHDASGHPVLWIGGTKGLLRHVVVNGPLAVRPTPPLLWAAAVTRQAAALHPITSVLPYTTRLIDFKFAEPDYALRAQIHLQTRIDGIDSDWVVARPDAQRELTAIRDGSYTFNVRAIAESGLASRPTTFGFTVAPPWWRTPAALVSLIALLIPLAYLLFRWRVRTLKHRNAVLEAKVRQRTEELAEASAAKTMFVANMSHDIRNPLNGIVGLSYALEETRLDSKQYDLVATLRECATYLSSLLDDVLDFATIEAGRLELRPGPYVTTEILNSVVTTLKRQAAERGATIAIECDPDLPGILVGDAGRIQQILVNYLSNALKYAGGDIRVSAGAAAGHPGEVEFSVADEGPGIDLADQVNLFTKFTRLEEARRDNVPGTGLGLASCRALADLMGGSVGVESRRGDGARFFLRLPLEVAGEPEPASPDFELPRTSVLLVEDTDYNATAATAILKKLGLACDRARTGQEALERFTAKRHNVVLLDRNLPDMDGLDVSRRIRELETDGMRSILLAVTAYCTAEDKQRCLDAGMDDFVGKPLTPEKLRAVLVGIAGKLLGSGTVDVPEGVAAAPQDDLVRTSMLEYLSDGSQAGLTAQVVEYIEILEQYHRDLESARSRGQMEALRTTAHRLVGHAQLLDATSLAHAATRLEVAARNADRDAISREMPAVGLEVENVKAALRRRPGAPKA